MKLYVWNKDWKTDWSSGIAVVLANSVEEARQVLTASAHEYSREDYARECAAEPDYVIDTENGPCVVADEGGGS